MTDKIQAIKDEIFRLKHNTPNAYDLSRFMLLEEIEHFIDSLPEEPKFKVGDMVISTNNPSLTYKVLQVGLPNELGNLDYKVEIFTDGKPGIKVGNTFKEHNIHLICCNRMDEWGKLISEEHASEDLEEAMELSVNEEPLLDFFATGQPTIGAYGKDSLRNQFEAGAEWQKQKDYKMYAHVPLKDIHDAWHELKNNKPDIENSPAICFCRGANWRENQMKEALQTEYEKGLFDMQQEMMKDAVEGEYWIGEIHLDTPIIQGYNDGDRIKFVPIKDKQQ